MAAGLILEFDGVGREHYDAVNERLGIDPATGEGDWPDGLLFHAGGAKPGGWVVMEVWESQEHQQRFMEGRLGPALQDGGITGPPGRVEWLELAAHHHLARS
jgi:hypothetical protein